MRSARRARFVALGIVLGLGLTVATGGDGAAQTAQPPLAGPSLMIVGAMLRQIGADLYFGLRFSRLVPVAQLQPERGRSVCILLGPDEPSRRRVCVSRRRGRLTATHAATIITDRLEADRLLPGGRR